ncbi:polyprenol phosphomannose-dependent alpha 1,6 mannosyltransferase MptB [Nocardioides sp. Kera G14]|uniref:polyprenol phosphomannose-dependent alpha 1,6 mannosyltransferase MptB n=1 Tax=Nocardioides sp. Kera G14 TaxID=2884264 RepID=UPI001D104D72|nr:polyprenol phosphomannose-dependent alpha 1,6 mannosyltransferase MptB [Nocardioides sp. Kera G14]UDY23943.1 polyprenol phosphomannose-dependent alpha 1,6 mannosyltransferase MptB [Nocardioides sp. Kera G14]
MLTRGLLGSLCVLLGGWVVATLPDSTPMLRHHLLVSLRDHEAGRMAGLTVIMLGLGLLAHAWLRLRVVVGGLDTADGLGLARFATVLWAAPLLIAPPLFSRDGWSYAAQGALVAAGISPYQHGPWILEGPVHEAVDPRWWFTPTPYGPLPVWWGAEMAHHTGNPLMLAIGHRVLALVGLVLLAWAMPRLARWTGVNPAVATVLVIASPMMIANGVGGLHNDLLMIGLMAAALVVGVERHWALGALLAGLAAAVKLPGGLVALGIVLATVPVAASLAQRARRAVEVGVVALGVLLGLGVVSGLGHGWIAALGVPGTVNTLLTPAVIVGGIADWTSGMLHLGTEPAFFIGVLRKLGTVATLAVLAWVALRWRTGDRRSAVTAVAVIVGALVLFSPVVQLWYFLWPLPFLAAVQMPARGRVALVIGMIVAGLIAPLDPSLHGAYVAIVLTVAMGLLVVGVLWLLNRSTLRAVFGSRRQHGLAPADPGVQAEQLLHGG